MGWLGVTLKQVLTQVRAGGWRCHSDVITVRDDTGWQGAGDVTHRKRAEVLCENLKRESGTRRQTRRVDFWARRREANLRSKVNKLKVNKKVSYLNKKSLRVFEFRDSYVLSKSIVMNITCLFSTQPYSCIWRCNSNKQSAEISTKTQKNTLKDS